MQTLIDILHKIADLLPHPSEGSRDDLHAAVDQLQADLDRLSGDVDAPEEAPAGDGTGSTPAADDATGQKGVKG